MNSVQFWDEAAERSRAIAKKMDDKVTNIDAAAYMLLACAILVQIQSKDEFMKDAETAFFLAVKAKETVNGAGK